MYKIFPKNRYENTLKMLKEVCPSPSVVFDLGVTNPFSEIMKQNNYKVYNTNGEDLDENSNIILPKDVDMVTGFEILEHLVSPYPLLKNLEVKRIFLTVPVNLWFAKAYKSKTDDRDRHYHEFEPWQFDMLLEKAGWRIIKKELWKNPSFKLGFRPFLRNFTNRYYAVYAERDYAGRWPNKEKFTSYYRGVLNL
jgi:hypothetical protein